MKQDFLTTPAAWTRAPRTDQTPAEYAEAFEFVSREEVDAVSRDADRLMYFIVGVAFALALLGVLA
jgi:hypothetical protein